MSGGKVNLLVQFLANLFEPVAEFRRFQSLLIVTASDAMPSN